VITRRPRENLMLRRRRRDGSEGTGHKGSSGKGKGGTRRLTRRAFRDGKLRPLRVLSGLGGGIRYLG